MSARSRARGALPLAFAVFGVAVGMGACAAPPMLTGTPDATGLMIVQAEIIKPKHFLVPADISVPPSRCAVARIDSTGGIRFAEAHKGLFVFSGLEPGPWYVKMIAGRETAATADHVRYVLAPDVVAGLTVSVEAGRAAYVGVIRVEETHALSSEGPTHTWTFSQPDLEDRLSLRRSAEAEAEAWRRFLETYGETAWAGIVPGR